jgi:uncharacterized OB-fold protein
MPRPTVNDLTRPFFDAAREHRLVIQSCSTCGVFRHPPRHICPHCRSFDVAWRQVDGRGRLFSWSVVHQQFHPAMASVVPYVVAIVELHDTGGTRLTSNLVDATETDRAVGRELEVVWEDMDEHLTLPRFRPRN